MFYDDLQTTELSDHGCTGKTTELVFVSWSKVQDKERGKRSPFTKSKQEIFSPFLKAEESRDLWLVIQEQQGDACRENYLRKRQTLRKL